MPNGRIGAIDTLIGERIKYEFLSLIEQKNIFNFAASNKKQIIHKILAPSIPHSPTRRRQRP